MHDDRHIVEQRLDRVLHQRLKPAQHTHHQPMDIAIWHTPGEPVPVTEALNATYQPAHIGQPWGPAWGTAWFRLTATIPETWAGHTVEALINLGSTEERPGFQCEGLCYTPDGTPLKAINPLNTYLPLPSTPGTHTIYVEAAANPDILGPRGFQPTHLGNPPTPNGPPLYQLLQADIALRHTETAALHHDAEVLDQLMRQLPENSPRRHHILRALERMLDTLDLHDIPNTATAARHQLTDVLASPAHPSAHHISAVGHAHIDSAWLWPIRETIRKVARTMANVTTLLDHHDFHFAMSQAQQLAWIKDHHPKLYDRVRHHINQGGFIPVGGMWVESDTNMPGGEALARQLIHGKRFFLDEFNIETQEVWLPDSFGYSAALPQLIHQSGSTWFLTQKLSWNQINRFPHHTFNWEGIDGTRIFTHFPPADTYNAEITGAELARAQNNFAEHGYANHSLLPFGHGDGGGGPTRDMLERAHRTHNLEGSPQVHLHTPAQFFTTAHNDHTQPPVYSGELYLELHRGTYTSQARTKQGNRRSEHLLREAELWCTTATLNTAHPYPYDELDTLWKQVLLHQFHDILPGSSIAWVHREAEATYTDIAHRLNTLIDQAQHALTGDGDQPITFNATPHTHDGIPALGAAPTPNTTPTTPHTQPDGTTTLDNGHIRATIDPHGLITSIHDHHTDREALAAPANLLQLHPDHPNHWDAWDIDTFYRNTTHDLTDIDTLHTTDNAIIIHRSFGNSTLTQTLTMPPEEKRLDITTDIDWHESEKLLKATFPLDVHADRSASETQFGHVMRPTHTNTSWDAARFEICAHRYLHVAEPGYGHTLVNDSTYGHDVTRHTRADGATTTTVRLSLLRAPRFPDPDTDHGHHTLRYALCIGTDITESARQGYRINLPARTRNGAHPVTPLITLDNPNIITEAVKLADDHSGDVIVRLYEAQGAQARTHLTTSFPATTITRTDLLERPTHDSQPADTPLKLRPFEIRTLRITRA